MSGAVTSRPLLPPAYRGIAAPASADAFARARASLRDGAEDGALYWSRRPDRLDAAVVLRPDEPVERALAVACVAMVGLGDALGALAPPAVSVGFRWPDQLHLNGALAGGLRLAWSDEPAAADDGGGWILLGVTVAITPPPGSDEPGRTPDRTTLLDEGCGDIGAVDLLEAFSRHVLAWINRWQDDGFAPVRAAWLSRAPDNGRHLELRLRDETVAGRMIGLDDGGGLILQAGGKQQRTVRLASALQAPTWRL